MLVDVLTTVRTWLLDWLVAHAAPGLGLAWLLWLSRELVGGFGKHNGRIDKHG